jgi:hypothetical protein
LARVAVEHPALRTRNLEPGATDCGTPSPPPPPREGAERAPQPLSARYMLLRGRALLLLCRRASSQLQSVMLCYARAATSRCRMVRCGTPLASCPVVPRHTSAPPVPTRGGSRLSLSRACGGSGRPGAALTAHLRLSRARHLRPTLSLKRESHRRPATVRELITTRARCVASASPDRIASSQFTSHVNSGHVDELHRDHVTLTSCTEMRLAATELRRKAADRVMRRGLAVRLTCHIR